MLRSHHYLKRCCSSLNISVNEEIPNIRGEELNTETLYFEGVSNGRYSKGCLNLHNHGSSADRGSTRGTVYTYAWWKIDASKHDGRYKDNGKVRPLSKKTLILIKY